MPLKYIFYGLAIILALSNIGGIAQGFGSPLLWGLMILFFVIGSVINTNKIEESNPTSSGVPQVPPLYPPAPKTVPVASGDSSFKVIKKKKNQEYVLFHKVYGSPIYMRTDDVYNPGDNCIIDMDDYKITEIEIQRSSKKIAIEKWLLPK